MNEKNYSIISYLTGEDYKVVRNLQKQLTEITGSKKCLTDWLPHITLADGITISESKLEDVESKLKSIANRQAIITSEITDVGNIDNWKGAITGKVLPYVIWLNVMTSEDLTNLYHTLQKEITSEESVWLGRTEKYVPHLTLAFSDLTKEGYEKGLDYLRNRDVSMKYKISHIALVECYREGNMTSVEHKRFYLN